jgi:hypothetical protein
MSDKLLYAIPPGLYCVPSALVAITGRDYESVIWPALNRHSGKPYLLGPIDGVYMHAAATALEELGYHVRQYKDKKEKPLRAQVRTWAKRFPDHTILLATDKPCLVARGGRVFDTYHPHGPAAEDHTYARTMVTWAALVQKKES